MKPIPIVGLALVAIAAGALSLAVHQRHRLAELRPAHPAAADVPEPASAPRVAAGDPTAPLSEAEHLELLKLRGQVKPLVEQLARSAVLSNQNARLQAKLAAARKPAPQPGPGYIRRAEARNLGNATPETALETFLYAAQNRDTNALFLVMGERMREIMAPELARQGVEGFFKSQGTVPGARVASRKEVGPDRVELLVEFIPGAPNMPLNFVRSAAGWELEP